MFCCVAPFWKVPVRLRKITEEGVGSVCSVTVNVVIVLDNILWLPASSFSKSYPGLTCQFLKLHCMFFFSLFFTISPDDARVRVWGSSERDRDHHHHPAKARPITWRTYQVISYLYLYFAFYISSCYVLLFPLLPSLLSSAFLFSNSFCPLNIPPTFISFISSSRLHPLFLFPLTSTFLSLSSSSRVSFKATEITHTYKSNLYAKKLREWDFIFFIDLAVKLIVFSHLRPEALAAALWWCNSEWTWQA